MIKIFRLALLATCVPLFAATPDERCEAASKLLDGVSAIDVGGGAIPGPLVLLSDNAIPLADCELDGTRAFAAAAAFYGGGRAVYLGHPAYLEADKHLADTSSLLRNAIRWLGAGRAEGVSAAALRGSAKVLATLRGLGVSDARRIGSPAELRKGDILVATEFREGEAAPVLKFVHEGGGLLVANLGWGFMFFHRDADFAETFADNRISGEMGVLMGKTSCGRVGGTFPATRGDIPAGTVATDALALVASEGESTLAVRKQVMKTLTVVAESLPHVVRPDLHAALGDLAKRAGAHAVPTPEHPVGVESPFARLAVLERKNAWQADPLRVWDADPAAEVYPGLVKPGTPSVDRTVPVDLSVPRWHSTGVFAPAGRALTVTIPDDATRLGLRLRIGSTADDLTGAQEWKRAPLVTVEVPLDKPSTTLASPFGGLVYVVVPQGAKAGRVDVNLAGGVMAPWFKLGRDTDEKFVRECAETGAPYGEIEGQDFIITSETRGLSRVREPGWIAGFWDRVLKADQELAQLPRRTSPERICSDVQLTMGWLHSGYPLMCHVNDDHFDWSIDKDRLERDGTWGVFHEIGHNHQNRDWTPDGAGEVTVNLFTCYALETVCGADIRDSRYPSSLAQANRRVKRWVARGKSFDEWKKDYFLALEMYIRIKEAYGWDAFKKAFASYLKPAFRRPANDADKWNVFARELSEATGHDMGAALSEWSIPLSAEARSFCAGFPPPDQRIVRGLVKKPYAPPPAEPVEGDYMGIALAGSDAGAISLYRTTDDIPGGPADTRWKTTHLLLRRVGPTDGTFTIGNRNAPKGWDGPREIEITKPYYFGVYEVTQEQWFHVMGAWKDNCFGAAGDRETRPVNGISYNQTRGSKENGIDWPRTGHAVAADSFIGRLRALVAYRAEIDLPTEAQWEYAARAGTTGRWNNGAEPQPYKGKRTSCDKVLDTLGRYCGNGGEPDDGGKVERGVATEFGTAAVGSYAPNAWGIYDTHGNVYEHCLDWWMEAGPDNGQTGADPVGPASSGEKDRRVMRGGSWWNFIYGNADACSSWVRNLGRLVAPGTAHEAVGFRLCVPAAIARNPQAGPDDEPLSPAAYEARRQLLVGVSALGSAGLPGPVYCLASNAFPVVAARGWDGEPAAMAAAAFYGKGRVVLVADSAFDASLADNARFRANADSWLSHDGQCKAEYLDLDTADAAAMEKAAAFVAAGNGLFVYGRAWPWRQREAAEKGRVRTADWPGNRLLMQLGLAVGDFCVSQTVAGGFSARLAPAEGCAVVPSSFYEGKVYPKPVAPSPAPLRDPSKGVIVRDGETIAFLGDSITRLGAQEGGYIGLVLRGLEKAGVKNVGKVPAGIDGNHSGDMLGRLGPILSNPSVRIMTVSCGVNDVWGFDWGRGLVLEEYKENVRAIYDKAARAGVLVVAVTPTLIGEDPASEKNRVLDQFADFIREEAKMRGLPLADPRADEIEALKHFSPDSGLHFTYDGVHPVKAGNELIARSILRALGVISAD